MGRALLVLSSDAIREKALQWVRKAPPGTRLTFQGPARTLPQNDRQWALLTAISRQLVWHGQRYSPDDWKDYFMHQLGGGRWMPSEEGGMVPIGKSTSKLSKEEHSDFTALIEAFAARHEVNLDE